MKSKMREAFEKWYGFEVCDEMDIHTEVAWDNWKIAWKEAIATAAGTIPAAGTSRLAEAVRVYLKAADEEGRTATQIGEALYDMRRALAEYDGEEGACSE